MECLIASKCTRHRVTTLRRQTGRQACARTGGGGSENVGEYTSQSKFAVMAHHAIWHGNLLNAPSNAMGVCVPSCIKPHLNAVYECSQAEGVCSFAFTLTHIHTYTRVQMQMHNRRLCARIAAATPPGGFKNRHTNMHFCTPSPSLLSKPTILMLCRHTHTRE